MDSCVSSYIFVFWDRMPLLPLESSRAKMASGDKIQRGLYVWDKYLIDIVILNQQICLWLDYFQFDVWSYCWVPIRCLNDYGAEIYATCIHLQGMELTCLSSIPGTWKLNSIFESTSTNFSSRIWTRFELFWHISSRLLCWTLSLELDCWHWERCHNHLDENMIVIFCSN